MPTINTIFFDWGGVIAGDPADDFLTQVLRKYGATDEQAQDIYDTYMRRFMRGELSESEYWHELKQHYGLDVPDTISAEFTQWRGLTINDAVFGLVEQAKAKGLQVALLTNVLEPTYNALRAAGHYEKFDKIIASCKVGFAKPQLEIYHLALKELNTTAKQSLFIDDKQRNLDPAETLGFHTILAENSDQIVRDIARYL